MQMERPFQDTQSHLDLITHNRQALTPHLLHVLRNNALTNTRIDYMPLLHFGLGDGGVIGTCHFNHPCGAHYWDRVLGQVPKNLFFLAEDWNL